MVEDPLSERILWKEFRVGETIIVDVEDSPIDGEGPQLSFRRSRGSSPRRSSWPVPAPTPSSRHSQQ